MSTVTLALFNGVSIVAAGTTGAALTTAVNATPNVDGSLFEDGREINLGGAITANVDNNVPVPLAQEISLRLPMTSYEAIVTEFGSDAAGGHFVTHNSTLAPKAMIILHSSVTGGDLVLDNVRIVLTKEIIEAGGEQVFAGVLTVTAKEAFGSMLVAVP
ncbi:hypothetical protein RZS08_06180 [Arthrospira platensis SPKY1]|nr:hypothetical protein [Arthrospira platensis SPKY1]